MGRAVRNSCPQRLMWLLLLLLISQLCRVSGEQPMDNVISDVDCKCHFKAEEQLLSCSNLSSSTVLNEPRGWCTQKTKDVSHKHVLHLTITGSQLDANFTLNSVKNFVNLRQLTLNHNNFSRGELIATDSSHFEHLEKLDLSSNNLRSISAQLLTAVPSLDTLRINDNHLAVLDVDIFSGNTKLRQIFMGGNPWWCNELEWLLDWLDSRPWVSVEQRSQVNCTYHELNTNFGSTTFENLLDECPRSCVCRMVRAMVKVDCRGRGLTAFPPLVPVLTGLMHMENNRIDSLLSLINGTNYLNLRFLYLDNNSIDSISSLESTEIFHGLFALHVSGNLLSQVPSHFIDRLFTQNLDQVKFGGNPWNCECKTVSPFRNLLVRNSERFKDIDQIRCASDGPYHPNQPIHKLLTSDFCFIGTYINPLDIVNVALVLIIVLIMAKVVYDYIRLRQTGRIPVGPFSCTHYTGYQQA